MKSRESVGEFSVQVPVGATLHPRRQQRLCKLRRELVKRTLSVAHVRSASTYMHGGVEARDDAHRGRPAKRRRRRHTRNHRALRCISGLSSPNRQRDRLFCLNSTLAAADRRSSRVEATHLMVSVQRRGTRRQRGDPSTPPRSAGWCRRSNVTVCVSGNYAG